MSDACSDVVLRTSTATTDSETYPCGCTIHKKKTFVPPTKEEPFTDWMVREIQQRWAANELGGDACWLLVVLAGQGGVVNLHQTELLRLSGFNDFEQLDKAMRSAEQRGWLDWIHKSMARPFPVWLSHTPSRRGEILTMDDEEAAA